MSNNHETRETSHETLKTCIPHQGSKIVKLINKFTNSPINCQNAPLHLSRELYKSNLFLQNEPNFKNDGMSVSPFIKGYYENLWLESLPKNKAKQTQNEPNFSPKLASFSRNEPNFKPNYVKIGNLCRPTLSRNVFRFYSVFCVLRPLLRQIIGFCFTKICRKMARKNVLYLPALRSPKGEEGWLKIYKENSVAKGILKIATCQFAVGGVVRRNSRQICHYIEKAAKSGADVVHFPESALSGYGGIDVPNFVDYDWGLLRSETEKIQQTAAKSKIYVVFGSAHKINRTDKPYQSLYLVNPEGQIQCRYDKRFCIKAELKRYTPGNRFVYFTINDVKCSLLICFDIRFPEIYRELYKKGIKCIFQSFYNAHQKGQSVHSEIMRQSMQCRAATNALWVSMSNSSGYYSPYPSCFIQPDGVIVKQLKKNKAGIMINTIDLKKKFYDPMEGFRELAVKGILSNRTVQLLNIIV